MDTDTFLPVFKQAIDAVDQLYFDREEWNGTRYGERVLCYELYHKVRSLLDRYIEENPDDYSEICFQAEVRKLPINSDIATLYGITPLPGLRIPDFLLHSRERGNFRRQELVVEVKTNPKLNFSEMRSDLQKIHEFMDRYHFQRGLFLAVNINPERLCRILSKRSSVAWLNRYLPDAGAITILCKEHQGRPLCDFHLADFLK